MLALAPQSPLLSCAVLLLPPLHPGLTRQQNLPLTLDRRHLFLQLDPGHLILHLIFGQLVLHLVCSPDPPGLQLPSSGDQLMEDSLLWGSRFAFGDALQDFQKCSSVSVCFEISTRQ